MIICGLLGKTRFKHPDINTRANSNANSELDEPVLNTKANSNAKSELDEPVLNTRANLDAKTNLDGYFPALNTP
jgi:hypothetical protein